jgi:hypothetical protein
MSFVCQIWEYPAPRDSAECKAILESLSRVRQPQNPRFVELAKRLTARYPCITTLEDDVLDEQGVWTDGPLDGLTEDAVYGVGILSQHLDTVFPFVCETANELGLNVYEMVAGETSRPDGTILEHDPDAAAPRLSSAGMNLTRLSEIFTEQLEPLARDRGFRKIGYHLVRGIDGGWQALVAAIVEVQGQVAFDVMLHTYRYDVMRLVHDLDPERRAGDANGSAFALSAYEFLLAPQILREPRDFLAASSVLKLVVQKHLLPGADECATLAGLDGVMNTSRTKFRHYPLNHLVVARLARSIAYDDLYHRMRERGQIDDALDPWLSATREVLAMRIDSPHETVVHSSYGPSGSQSWVTGPGKK